MPATGGAALGIPYAQQEFDTITTRNLTVTGTQTVATEALADVTISGSAAILNASTDTLAFYGATLTTQPAAISAVTTATLTSVTTTAASSTTPYGYTTSTQADAIVATLNAVAVRAAALTTEGNAIRAAIATLGLTA